MSNHFFEGINPVPTNPEPVVYPDQFLSGFDGVLFVGVSVLVVILLALVDYYASARPYHESE
jgi:hypothetical protein